MKEEPILIKSEEDALRYLETITDSSSTSVEHFIPVIIGWDEWNLKIKGERYNGTLDIDIINALIELQNSIYKLYAYVKYNVADRRRLTNEEEQCLKISISVEKGSTDITVEVLDIIKRTVDAMPPGYSLTVLITGIVLYFGRDYYKMWLDQKTKNKELELKGKELDYNTEQEENRNHLLENIISSNEQNIRNIIAITDEKHTNILKHLKNTNADIEYCNQSLTHQETKDVVKTHRVTKMKSKSRLDGIYRLLSNNYEKEELTLEVVEVDGLQCEQVIVASYTEVANGCAVPFQLSEERLFFIKINGSMSNDIVEEASILSIEEQNKTQ